MPRGMKPDRKIEVGVILGAHGVQGAVRLRSFTEDPEAIFRYKGISDEKGERTFSFRRKGAAKGVLIATLQGVIDRNSAESLRGTKLFVNRSALPPLKKREYYETDMIGLSAEGKDGRIYGKVIALHDYGAGAFLEIKPEKGASFMLPFNDDFVPDLDLKTGRLTAVMPSGWLTEKPARDKRSGKGRKRRKKKAAEKNGRKGE